MKYFLNMPATDYQQASIINMLINGEINANGAKRILEVCIKDNLEIIRTEMRKLND